MDARRAALPLCGLLAGCAAVLQTAAVTTPGAWRPWAAHAAWTLVAAAATGACAVAARCVGAGRTLVSWRLWTAAAGVWLAGAFARDAVLLGAPHSISRLADACWLTFAAFAFGALAVRSPRGLLSFRLFFLDALPVVLVAVAAALQTSEGHGTHLYGELTAQAVTALYAGLYVLSVAIALQLMALEGFRRVNAYWWNLAGGLFLLALAALVWPRYGETATGAGEPAWAATPWTGGLLLLALTAIRRVLAPSRTMTFRSTERESSLRALPPAAATLTLMVLAVDRDTRHSEVIGILALVGVVAFALRSSIARHRTGRIVDDLVRSREALRESEERFRSIFESTAIGVSVTDPEGRIIEANRALETMLGLGPGELIGHHFAEFTHADDADWNVALHNELMRGERETFQVERRYVCSSGETVWGRLTASMIRDELGRPFLGISAIENVDERMQAEASLSAVQARYRNLVEQLPLATYIEQLDAASAGYMSPQIERMVGYTADEWTADPDFFGNVLHPDDRQRVLEEFAEMHRLGEACDTEYRIIARDGGEVWIRDAAVVVHDEDGRPLYAQGYMIDITERHHHEEQLRRRQAILEAVARVSELLLSESSWEQAADGVLRLLGEAAGVSRAYIFENRVDSDGRLLTSQRFEWVADGIERFIRDPSLQDYDMGEAGYARFQEILASGGIVAGPTGSFPVGERTELERQGTRSILIAPIVEQGWWWGWLGFDECVSERIWAEGEIDAVRAAAGTLGAAIQRERAEATERDAVQRLQSVVEASPAAIVGLDRAGNVVIWNPAAEAMFGWRAAEVLGRPNPNVPPEGQEQFQDLLNRGVSGASWTDLEIVRRRQDGTEVHVSSSAAPMRDGTGAIVGAVVVLVDIDERKAAERERERLLSGEREARAEAEAAREQLAEQNEQLLELDGLKDEFVALVSHELRTPLTSILGYLEFVLDGEEGDLSDGQREFLGVVQRNSHRLLRLVGDLLFLAQVDAGKLSFEREPVELATLGRECVEAAQPQAEAKGVEVVLRAQDVPPVEGDRMRLAQLLDNLVSNAVKFTPSGGRVEIAIESRAGGALISVTDTGIGVSISEQGRLFERFFRTAGATQRAIQGTGLGLAISKTIAEAHGGRITFASEEGVGTTFWVELPSALAIAA